MMKLKMIVLIPIAVLITTSMALFVGPSFKIYLAYFDIQELAFPKPYRNLKDITYDRDKKIVYFSYIQDNSVNLAFYDYYTGEIEKLEVDANVTCLDVDSATSTLYIGTDNGIKSMMPKHSHEVTQLNVKNKIVTSVYYRDELIFYTTKKSAFVYEPRTGDSTLYGNMPKGFFDKFVVDSHHFKIFMDSETQEGFWMREDMLPPRRFFINVTDIVVDQEHQAYVSSHNALHFFDNENLQLVKVADIRDIDRMALVDMAVPIYISDGWLRRVSYAHELCRVKPG